MSNGNITNWKSFSDEKGNFKRPQAVLRNSISNKPGSKFPAERNRYHLYISYACPWAHRILIARKLKGLEDIIPFTCVHWLLKDGGWRFVTAEDNDAEGENAVPDPLHEGFTHLRQVYYETDADYQARFSVPVLYDKIQKTIVNNESSEILRMFGTEFDDIIDPKYRDVSLYPKALQSQIDEVHEWHYDNINNGVYKCGIASTQEAYERVVTELFEALDKVEDHLASTGGPYWFGQSLTEVDIRLYVTVIRFDPVYVQHFKCNIRDIRSGYPNIHKWLRNLYWNIPAFKETTNFHHIKNHYTKSHTPINPLSITPVGPLPHILPLDREVAAVEAAAQL
ncbi:glutathione S-transferase [Trichoderma gamsii]|uniref:Glutathione S-transferase omega-like 2 n=1 Tax=Trichoderma gamsii TaxID=398673 RepID=A0A2P4Z8F9_9HYPO|nr:glutathione S-transferase [Trichoderma gamsii]PON20579.1 glutathione S-transferase [Trichoderma gamsii]